MEQTEIFITADTFGIDMVTTLPKLSSTVEARFNMVVGGHASYPRYSLTAVYRNMTI